MASIELLPTGNAAVANAALPPNSATVLLPGKATPLSSKVTVPVGVPAAVTLEATKTVKVSVWPNTVAAFAS